MTTRHTELRTQIAGLESLVKDEKDTGARRLYENKLAALRKDLEVLTPDRDLGETIYMIVKAAKDRYSAYKPETQEAFCIDIGAEARIQLERAGWMSPKDAKRTSDFAKAMGKIRTSIIRELGLPSHISDEEFVATMVKGVKTARARGTSTSGDYLSASAAPNGRIRPGLRPINDLLAVALYQQPCEADTVFGPDRDGEYWKLVRGEGKVEQRFGRPDRLVAVTIGIEKLAS